ncbi:hypothetical protein QR680_017723 [Steinernema hermaphroditum]|uniref:Tyr recombinase domain-containing protein n=1 Tax=Steinernema hermaphroditum TaxID=289476 RepID=A0AA39LPW6_9BILA|nr:hypothetical protein QR680_017723 [Steinernema hermaphroditum]
MSSFDMKRSLASIRYVFGPAAQLKARSIHAELNSMMALPQSARQVLSVGERGDLIWWKRNIRHRNWRPLHKILNARRIATDASATGAGVVIWNRDGSTSRTAINFTPHERAESSTYREVLAVEFGLRVFSSELSGSQVIVEIDNVGAVSIIQKGSPKPGLQSAASAIFELAETIGAEIVPVWVPRDQNMLADEASRLIDRDDWGISPDFFQICCQRWGTPSIDVFANNIGSEGVNAFASSWATEFVWAVPPPNLIPLTVAHLLSCKGRAILGVPWWPSHMFFPSLWVGLSWAWFVKDFICVEKDPFDSIKLALCSFINSSIADRLIATIRASREQSTLARYEASVNKFCNWRQQGTTPPTTEEVLAFLGQLFCSTSSMSVVQSAAAAIKWHLKFLPGNNPVESVWIRAFLEGLRRQAPPVQHRQKVTEAEIRLIAGWESTAVKDRRMIAYLCLLFAGCLRPSEGLRLLRKDLVFSTSEVTIRIEKDKTRKEGPPRITPIRKSSSSFCALKILQDWLCVAPTSQFVFPNLKNPKAAFSYDAARKELARLANVLGFRKDLTLHGFRGGSATAAIANGAPIDEVMRFGGWKRQATLDAYVEVSATTVPTASASFDFL